MTWTPRLSNNQLNTTVISDGKKYATSLRGVNKRRALGRSFVNDTNQKSGSNDLSLNLLTPLKRHTQIEERNNFKQEVDSMNSSFTGIIRLDNNSTLS